MIRLPQLDSYESTPWELPQAQRLKQFYQIVREGKKAAVLLYREADTSTFRYRCYNIMQALCESEQWGAVCFFEQEYPTVIELLPQTDMIVMTRVKWTTTLNWLVEKAKQRMIPVVFDVDDRVFDLDALNTFANTLAIDLEHEYACDFWFANIARIQQAAALADGYFSTNDYLGKKLQEKFNKPYQIIPNSVNREQLAVSEILSKQKQQLVNARPFAIGYFSGSPTHINDFLEIYKDLLVLLNKYPDIILEVVGFMEFPQEMQSLLQAGRIRFTPLVDFIELQRLIAQVDVNIVPLVNNSFTNCKSELKYFEAALVDTITVATPIYSYRNNIKNGENGFLCRPGQWFETLESIYLERVNRTQICVNAKKDVLQRYCGKAFVEQIEHAYNFFEKSKGGCVNETSC